MSTWNEAGCSTARLLLEEPTGFADFRGLFDFRQYTLLAWIEQASGVKVHNIVAGLAPDAGLSTVVIKLREPLAQSTTH